MKKLVVKLIEIYQRTLSPDYGWFRHRHPFGYCKFSPSCSEYCKQAIEKHGLGHGSYLGLRRILRCNPWSKGGHDPV